MHHIQMWWNKEQQLLGSLYTIPGLIAFSCSTYKYSDPEPDFPFTVSDWLCSINLEAYVSKFEEHNIGFDTIEGVDKVYTHYNTNYLLCV